MWSQSTYQRSLKMVGTKVVVEWIFEVACLWYISIFRSLRSRESECGEHPNRASSMARYWPRHRANHHVWNQGKWVYTVHRQILQYKQYIISWGFILLYCGRPSYCIVAKTIAIFNILCPPLRRSLGSACGHEKSLLASQSGIHVVR
jgi:hypothetical protein